MAITPVTGFSPVRNWNNNISFGERIQDVDETDYRPHKSSNLKRVPVIVMIAMSPLTTANTAASQPVVFEPINATEITQQPGIIKRTFLKNGNETMKIITLNNDDNYVNFENMGFNYSYEENNKKGVLSGMVMAICNTQRSDGQYLLAYKETLRDNSLSGYKLCYISKNFGQHINLALKSGLNNSPAAAIPLSEFNTYFGKDAVKNAPTIKTSVTRFENINH